MLLRQNLPVSTVESVRFCHVVSRMRKEDASLLARIRENRFGSMVRCCLILEAMQKDDHALLDILSNAAYGNEQANTIGFIWRNYDHPDFMLPPEPQYRACRPDYMNIMHDLP